ncbi:MAG TPA: hypothetical protein VFG02_01925 [Nitrospirota bacterium]|nr:hypothetical protein [Nitrospirota bacterium]
MRRYMRLMVFSIVAVAILFFIYVLKQTSAPESAIIAKERDQIYSSRDKSRLEKDPLYARELQDKLQFLGARLAVAYNAENRPDEAIAILQQLISDEEAKGKTGILRRSRSYVNEAQYYEVLKESYDLKHDEDNAQKATKSREDLLAKAAELRIRESREEGKSVGLHAE